MHTGRTAPTGHVATGFGAILLGMSVSVIMQTLIATALPTIVRELGGMHLYSWVFGGYMLAATVTIPLFGKLADLFGRRALYLSGLAAFVLGSTLAAGATSMAQLVSLRVLQGVGAGAIAPAALATVGDLLPAEKVGRAYGLIGAVQVLANLAGPTLGGWLTDGVGWRWGFVLVLPVGLLTAALAAHGIPAGPRQGLGAVRTVDFLGAALLGSGVAAFLLGAEGLPSANPVLTAVALSIALLLILLGLRVERRHADPVLPLSLLQQPALGEAAGGAVLVGAITYGAVAYLPLYAQETAGASATGAGGALLPMLLMAGVGSALAGLVKRHFPRLVPAAAWLLAASGLMLIGLVQPRSGSILLTVATGTAGLGTGLLLPLFLQVAHAAAGEAMRASASGVVQLGRNLGGAISVPLLGVWVTGGGGAGVTGIFLSLALTAGAGFLVTVYHARGKGQTRRAHSLV